MPISATPKYLGSDFSSASPGLRFTMYLPIWTDRSDQEREVNQRASAKSKEGHEIKNHLDSRGMDATIEMLVNRDNGKLPGLWEKNDHGAKGVWSQIVKLNPNDINLQKMLVVRQGVLAQSAPEAHILNIQGKAIAPFTTGLGNEHPLDNGFAFLTPYGIPYLPGSGVKGVLRQAARELASGDWGDTHGWKNDFIYPLTINGKTVFDKSNNPVMLSMLDVLFGRDVPNGDSNHVRGAFTFWDVIPQIKGDRLNVEIMTPHQKHYFQDGETPHDSGLPIPISFLTVPPESTFTFFVQCDLTILKNIAPELENQWQDLLKAAFKHAFKWLGFGAKTAVGYGVMEHDEEASKPAAIREAEAWLSASVEQVKKENNIPNMDEVYASKPLAEKWASLDDPEMKSTLLSILKEKWKKSNRMPSKKAHQIYISNE